jgi:hypothetical protein
MFAQSAAATPQVPWWSTAASPLAGLAGIIIGFTLKAWFDSRSEKQRQAREDLLRFVNEKIKAYGEFGAIALQIRHIIEVRRSNIGRIVELTGAIETLKSEHTGMGSVELAAQYRILEYMLKALELEREQLYGRRLQQIEALNKIYGLMFIIAPPPITDAAAKMAATVYDMYDDTDFRMAFAQFSIVAAEDLGIRSRPVRVPTPGTIGGPKQG